MNLSVYVIPAILVLILVMSAFKRIDILKEFTIGANEGLKTALSITPTLIILMTAIGMFKASGAVSVLETLLSPITEAVGIPKEVISLMLLKPFSGSGSIGILKDIFETNGADSFVGRVASVIAAATETTFYTIAVYYGSVAVTKTRHTVAAALTADICGFVLSAFFVRIFFG